MKQPSHKKNFWSLALFFSVFIIKSQPIPAHFFGVNAWMPEAVGSVGGCTTPPCALFGDMDKNWGNVKASSATIVRYGGIAVDRNKPTNEQYVKAIDSIKANNMEPVVQVPFFDYKYTAQEAASIVNYINVVSGLNVKYWIVANEPDLSYGYTTAAQIAAYFKTFASAMKSVDPNILIIGPELAIFKPSIVAGLTTPGGPSDITGKDAAGRYYLDIFSFHAYPLGIGNQTRAEVNTKLTSPEGFDDDLKFLRSRLDAANLFHNRSGVSALKIAVTEANVNFRNHPADDLYGLCTNSFAGGQFVAEMYGIGMKNGVEFMNVWSVIEGATNAQNTGYIDSRTDNKKPLYYHFQMMAQNFKGSYVNSVSSNLVVKSFACQNSNETIVLLLNEDAAQDFSYTLRLNATANTPGASLQVAVAAGINSEYSDVLPKQSSVVLVFNSLGQLVRRCDYILATHAANNAAPTCSITPLGINSKNEQKLDVAIFPNPSMGEINIDFSDNIAGAKQICVYDPLGKLISKKNVTAGIKQITIDLGEFPKGVYFVEVTGRDNKTVKKIVLY